MGCAYSKTCIGDVCFPRDAQFKERGHKRKSELPVFSPASSEDPVEEIRDQLNLSSINRDFEVGISRLSRISSQFLPPEGSRTVKVPSGNYELQYSYLTQRGYYPDALDKANQDSFCCHAPFGFSLDDHFFGVFDGHGEFGAQCSQFVKRKLCENLLKNCHSGMDAVEACHTAFLATNSQLHADCLDDSMSGTTAITILVRGRTICVANTGDSRAVIAERRGKEVVAVDLSIDQTPFRADELERVQNCGARVLTMDQIEGLKDPDVQCWGTEEGDEGDPPRLWVQNGMYPGTAFTRSIGDSIAETIGVVATPEISVLELTPNHPFFVIASDGVFEFLSSQSVIDMVTKFEDPHDACAAVVAEAYRLWLQYETRTDDISVIVVQINGLTDNDVVQSAPYDSVVKRPQSQVLEVARMESPATIRWQPQNQFTSHDLSRARICAIESSLENMQFWVPSSAAHRKTWEEKAHIERALHDHFLFKKLTSSQIHVLLDCMQRVEVQAGDIVVQQGSEGDCFYVVGRGEFEVLASQGDKNAEVPRFLHRYSAEKLSSFGDLALMYNKPLQASVCAVTSGTLWSLKREDFRGILMSEFSNLTLLKLLRSVDLLSRLTILQLSHIADSLSEVSFSDGQTMIHQNENVSALYIIQKGQVRITYDMELFRNPDVHSLLSESETKEDGIHSSNVLLVEKAEGTYFGEWSLLGEHVGFLCAVAVGEVVCFVLTKETFDLLVGPLMKLPEDDERSRGTSLNAKPVDPPTLAKVQLPALEWRACLYNTDCSEVGLVYLRETENLLSLKRFSKTKVKKLAKDVQVLKEKDLMKSLYPSACVPRVLCTCADQTYAGLLLDTCLACPFACILHTAFDEPSARFCAASVVVALGDLHKKGIIYRGVSPDVLMFDQTGHLQLVDFRFGKKLNSERTFTLCGMADSLAPEIVQGTGHSLPADWWALGVLIYFMLQGEMPFGSRRQNEVGVFAKVTVPQNVSPEAADLITKLLQVDENARLGSSGLGPVKSHPWFNGIDWRGIEDGSFNVPHEITKRLAHYMECHSKRCSVPRLSPSRDVEMLNSPEWLEDW